MAVNPELDPEAGRGLLAEVGLADYATAFPNALSGGMQRRVALARALAVRPQLLLLDEPFVSVDRKLALELQDLLLRVIDSFGPTVMLVTHDPDDAARLADRVLRIGGRPAQITLDRTIETAPNDRSRDQVRALAEAFEAEGTA